MQVRAGGPAGLSDETDGIALRDARAAAHRDAAEVRIHRRVLAVVAQDHYVAIAAFDAGVFHHRVAYRAHARAARRRIVGALVRAPALLDRVQPHAEARADARER